MSERADLAYLRTILKFLWWSSFYSFRRRTPSKQSTFDQTRFLFVLLVFSSGQHIARIPIGNVRISKLLLYGAIFNCISPILIICAILSSRPIFYSPVDRYESVSNFLCWLFTGAALGFGNNSCWWNWYRKDWNFSCFVVWDVINLLFIQAWWSKQGQNAVVFLDIWSSDRTQRLPAMGKST